MVAAKSAGGWLVVRTVKSRPRAAPHVRKLPERLASIHLRRRVVLGNNGVIVYTAGHAGSEQLKMTTPTVGAVYDRPRCETSILGGHRPSLQWGELDELKKLVGLAFALDMIVVAEERGGASLGPNGRTLELRRV